MLFHIMPAEPAKTNKNVVAARAVPWGDNRAMKDVEFITWLDHCTDSERGWQSLENILKLEPVVIDTVGWVVKETDDYLVMAASLQDVGENANASDQDAQGEMLVLKSCIKRREKLNLS